MEKFTCSPWDHGVWPEKCCKPSASVRVLSQRPLSRVSRLLANDKGDNEMIPGAVHRSPGIYLTVEESPGIPQLEDCR